MLGLILGILILLAINHAFGFEGVLVALLIWIILCLNDIENAIKEQKKEEEDE